MPKPPTPPGQTHDDDSLFLKRIATALDGKNGPSVLLETLDRIARAMEAQLPPLDLLSIEHDLERIADSLDSLVPQASRFGFSQPTLEPTDPAPFKGETMPPTQVPGPVPANNRVVIGLRSLNSDGSQNVPIDGDLQVTRDDDGTQEVIETEAKKKWTLKFGPPSDLTHDTSVSIMDSDNAPADVLTIDWDGPVIVPQAAQFGFDVSFEPNPVV